LGLSAKSIGHCINVRALIAVRERPAILLPKMSGSRGAAFWAMQINTPTISSRQFITSLLRYATVRCITGGRMLSGKQNEKSTSIRMRECHRMRDEGRA
jgi:hypothetical protein